MATAQRPADALGWVADALRAERLAFHGETARLSAEMERRHGEMLGELRKVLDAPVREADAGGEPPSAERTEALEVAPSPPGDANGEPLSAPHGKPPSAKTPPRQLTPTEEESADPGVSEALSKDLLPGNTDDDLAPTSSARKRGKKAHKLRSETHVEEHSSYTLLDKVSHIVSHDKFEITFAILILLNTVMMAVEAQYNGLVSCYSLSYPGCGRPDPRMHDVFAVLENIFGVLFTLEVVAKLLGQRIKFFHSWWNWFDSVVIVAWLVNVLGNGLPMNPMVLRLVRMFRLLRLVRLLRASQIFETLHLMIAAIRSSLTVALWMSVFLFLIMLTCTLVLTSMLDKYYHDESQPPLQRQEVYTYFGTFSRGFLSMFEVTLGNWVPITRMLHESVSEWFGPLVLIYRTLVGEALIKVVTGVFMYETFRCAQADDEMMIMEKSRATRRHSSKMQMLFEEADESGDGSLDRKEFTEACTDPRIAAWLAAMDIQINQVSDMFSLLDHGGDNRLSHDELAKGLARLKGPARAFEMALLMNKISKDMEIMKDKIADIGHIKGQLADLPTKLGDGCYSANV